ncbi:MAG: CoA transferase [Pseudomonadota bacterium]
MSNSFLDGVRVLDLTNVLAGPFCCHQLAHLGADVIKVEVPQHGDLARQLGADPELNQGKMGISFLAQNSGKRSITVNLKSDAGKVLFKRLVASADVLVENFRPGVMDRLGVGYNALVEEKPELVYCAISGFGQDGPLRNEPAYDQIIQGMSGVMSITGDADTAPYRVGYPMADTIGGLTAAFAVSAALTKSRSERGCFIDVSMLEAVISTMGWAVSNYLVAGKAPQPLGNDNVTASPSGTFKTGDGLLNIAANKQEQFEAVCEVVGNTDLISDPRFVDRQARLDNRQALVLELERALAADTASAWRAALNAAGVPAGRVLSVEQALAHPQVADRGLIARFDRVPGVGRAVDVAGAGFKINGDAPRTKTPAPQLGEHTQSILDELGYAPNDIESLQRDGAI